MFTFTRELFRSLFKKSATVAYPKQPAAVAQGVRGQVSIDIEECIFCGQCQRRCPPDAITVTRAERRWEINRFRCILCNSCVEVCPKKCLHMKEKLSEASDTHTIYAIVAPPPPTAIASAPQAPSIASPISPPSSPSTLSLPAEQETGHA
ncbi:MAG: 4Fe-4S binding protein [Oscillospiraceae bacterium]|nr:4Fe-4S binding protein [Oscillospiraceae bacterium]